MALKLTDDSRVGHSPLLQIISAEEITFTTSDRATAFGLGFGLAFCLRFCDNPIPNSTVSKSITTAMTFRMGEKILWVSVFSLLCVAISVLESENLI